MPKHVVIYMTFMLIQFSCVWLVYLPYPSTCERYGLVILCHRTAGRLRARREQ